MVLIFGIIGTVFYSIAVKKTKRYRFFSLVRNHIKYFSGFWIFHWIYAALLDFCLWNRAPMVSILAFNSIWFQLHGHSSFFHRLWSANSLPDRPSLGCRLSDSLSAYFWLCARRHLGGFTQAKSFRHPHSFPVFRTHNFWRSLSCNNDSLGPQKG